MDVEKFIAGLLLALAFPLFPVSLITSFILQRYSRHRSVLFIGLVFIGSLLWERADVLEVHVLRYLALFTSVLYAFRSLTANSLERWIVYMFISAFSLIWVLPADSGAELLPLVIIFAFPFLVVSLVERVLTGRFGTSNLYVVSGLALGAPLLGLVTTLSILAVIGVPASGLFAKVFILTALSPGYLETLLVMVAWFFWGWSGIRVLSSLVFRSPRENFKYEDLGKTAGYGLLLLSVLSLCGGYLLFEAIFSLGGWGAR